MDKAETLRAFLNSLPARAAAKLLAAIESGALPPEHLGLSLEDLRYSLGAAPDTFVQDRQRDITPQRLFAEPFEDFLFDGERSEKVPGSIPRSSVEPIWSWVKHDLLPDAFPDMVERIYAHLESGDEAALRTAVTVMQEAAGGAILKALEDGYKDENKADKLLKKLGDFKIIEDAREIADTLLILDAVKKMQNIVPRDMASLDEHTASGVRDLYDELYARDADRAIYLALAVMGRLRYPWQILRLTRKIAQKSNDTMISRTDFSILGERLIRRLEVIASYFESLRLGLSNLEELHQLIVEFSELSQGITKEIELLRIGNWGQRLLKGRNTISTAISDEFSHYLKDLSLALPLQRVGGFGRSGPRRVDISHVPVDERVARIRRELTFMKNVENYAQTIGAKNAYDKTKPELTAYMVSYEDAIIEELRCCDPSATGHGGAFLELAAELTELITNSNDASVLRKRGRVALQTPA